MASSFKSFSGKSNRSQGERGRGRYGNRRRGGYKPISSLPTIPVNPNPPAPSVPSIPPNPPKPIKRVIDPNSYLARAKPVLKQKEVAIISQTEPEKEEVRPTTLIQEERQLRRIHKDISRSRARTYKSHYNLWVSAWHDEIEDLLLLIRENIEMNPEDLRQYVQYLYATSVQGRKSKVLPFDFEYIAITMPSMEEPHTLHEFAVEHSRTRNYPFFEIPMNIRDFMPRAFCIQYLY